jgi:hypothetical protein
MEVNAVLYGCRDRKIAAPAAAQPPEPWHARLPADWRGLVRPPLRFEVFREPELKAERCFGYDAQRIACYYAHSYRIEELRTDDDEEFYLCTLYGETLTAWLLDDGRWLIHRLVRTDEHCPGQAFYSFSQSMPR